MNRFDFSADEILKFLHGVPLFASLPEACRRDIAASSTRTIHLGAGEWLFHEGEPGDELFVVLSGILVVVREREYDVIQYLGKGECVGELSLVTEMTRSASVRAVRDVELLSVRRSEFTALVDKNPEFARALTRILGERLHKTVTTPNAPMRPNRVLTMISIANSAMHRKAIDALFSFLKRGARAVFLAGRPSEMSALNDEALDMECGRRLSELESGNDYVVLICDPHDDVAWRKFCLRQADRIIVIVDDGSVIATPIARKYLGCDLVFVGVRDPIAALEFWKSILHPRACHLVRDSSEGSKDIERLGRRITGRAIGLVLSGGAARGMAHIGVIEALAEAGVTIDRVGGSSMGALIAAMYAIGRSTTEMKELCRDELPKLFSGFALPLVALMSGKGAYKMLHAMVGRGVMEELAMPLFTVSSDLVHAESYVHRSGPIAIAVAASAAIPVILPPVRSGDRILVDGCILNNLPTDVMVSENEGPVIASDVIFSKAEFAERLTRRNESVRPSLKSRVGMYLRRGHADLPELWVTATRSALLNSVQTLERKRALAQLAIVSDCDQWGLFEFDKADEIVEAGRKAAREALAKNPPL